MSNETTPLLPTHLQPSQAQIDSTVESAKETAFSISLALGALRAGKLPSGDQLDALLKAALDSEVLSLGVGRGTGRTGRLSEEGARVVKSLREVIEAVRVIGQEKNGDDKLQETIYSLSQVEAPSAPARGSRLDPATSSTIPGRREVESDGHKTLKSLQTILTLLVTSSEFRLVLNQAISLASSVLADGAHAVAENASEVEKKAREAGSDDKPIDIEETKRKGKKVAKGLVSGRIQGEAKEEALNQFEGLAHYFQDKISSDEEAKDKLFEKLKAVVVSVQKDSKYQESIDTLLSLVKKYGNKAEQLADAAAEKVDAETDQSELQDALADTRTIIERFANGESLEPVLTSINNLKEDVTSDGEVKKYFDDLGRFIEASLKVEGYVVSQRAARRSNELWDRGQKLGVDNPKYRKDVDELTKSLEDFATALGDDDSTAELGFKLEEFAIELTHAGKSGLNALRAESSGLYRDVIDVFLPRLIALVKEIPMPRMEFKSADIDFVIDDLSIKSASFIPDSIRIVQHNDLSLVQGYAAYAADYDGSLRVRVDGLRFNAESISYWVNKKSGLFPFEDEGLLDVSFDNKGISFEVELENAEEKDRETFFVVKKVHVDVSDLDYSISKNRSWMLWFAQSTVGGLIKHSLKSTLETQITTMLKDADLELYGLQNRAIAATNAKPTALNYVKAVFSPSLFSGSSTSKVTQKGVVKHGRRGEYLLAIGVTDHIFAGKAGPSDAHAKREGALNKLKEFKGRAESAVDAATFKGADAKNDAERAAGKLGLTVKQAARQEAKRDGWRSDLFDL